MAYKLIGTWNLLISYLNSIIYVMLFAHGSLTCKVFRFQWWVIYQWVLLLIVLLFIYKITREFKHLDWLKNCLKLIILRPRYAKELRSKVNMAKQHLNTPSAASFYLATASYVDGFASNMEWRHCDQGHTLWDPHADDARLQANELDTYFWKNVLVKEFRNQLTSKSKTADCCICSSELEPHQDSLLLSCCDTIVHWYCMKRYVGASGRCPSCSIGLRDALRDAVSNILNPKGKVKKRRNGPLREPAMMEEAELAEV